MKSLGFIGAGRIVRIFIEALSRQEKLPDKIVVSDPNRDVIKKLQHDYPAASIVEAGAQDVAAQDIVFIAVHPPQIAEVCKEISGFVKTSAIVVSLAPVVKSEKLAALLGTQRLVRMIPNAASFINTGYNPVWFSKYIGETEKNLLTEIFSTFGTCPEVEEAKLEAYAIVTAMGPTYLWPQLDELHKLGLEFGLTDEETQEGMQAMVKNTIELLYDSGLDYNAVVDLIPVKPLGESEQTFREIYKTKLTGLYNKLSGK